MIATAIATLFVASSIVFPMSASADEGTSDVPITESIVQEAPAPEPVVAPEPAPAGEEAPNPDPGPAVVPDPEPIPEPEPAPTTPEPAVVTDPVAVVEDPSALDNNTVEKEAPAPAVAPEPVVAEQNDSSVIDAPETPQDDSVNGVVVYPAGFTMESEEPMNSPEDGLPYLEQTWTNPSKNYSYLTSIRVIDCVKYFTVQAVPNDSKQFTGGSTTIWYSAFGDDSCGPTFTPTPTAPIFTDIDETTVRGDNVPDKGTSFTVVTQANSADVTWTEIADDEGNVFTVIATAVNGPFETAPEGGVLSDNGKTIEFVYSYTDNVVTVKAPYIIALWEKPSNGDFGPQKLVYFVESFDLDLSKVDAFEAKCGTPYQSDAYNNDAVTAELLAGGVLYEIGNPAESWPGGSYKPGYSKVFKTDDCKTLVTDPFTYKVWDGCGTANDGSSYEPSEQYTVVKTNKTFFPNGDLQAETWIRTASEGFEFDESEITVINIVFTDEACPIVVTPPVVVVPPAVVVPPGVVTPPVVVTTSPVAVTTPKVNVIYDAKTDGAAYAASEQKSIGSFVGPLLLLISGLVAGMWLISRRNGVSHR